MTTSVQDSTATPHAHERQVPPLGGFNLTALKLEVRRVLRNRRTVMFILVFPSVSGELDHHSLVFFHQGLEIMTPVKVHDVAVGILGPE